MLRERDQIEALTNRSRREMVSARGVALARLLIHDAHGPLYQRRQDRTLPEALAKIAQSL